MGELTKQTIESDKHVGTAPSFAFDIDGNGTSPTTSAAAGTCGWRR
jgi:hypothetical protein